MTNQRSPLLSSAIVIAALGYFVDVYDIILFSVVRVASLTDLGVAADKRLEVGVHLMNYQMIGMLVGGILWGVLADKIGRMKALFGSILMYSVANILNGCIGSVEQYAILRLIAGVGLAGELGAGITLISEILPKEKRGYGTTIVASVGIAGAVVAGLTGELMTWRVAYIIGGVMGLALLALRVSVAESGIFNAACEHGIARGKISTLFRSRERFLRYLRCILIGLPIWFIVGILVSMAPEVTAALGAPTPISAGRAVFWCYVGLFFGDTASGLLSQILASRKKAVGAYLLASFIASIVFLSVRMPSDLRLTLMYVCLGFTAGFWVLVVTTSAEQFGTNVRATVTTTVPNFIRGAAVPMNESFVYLKATHGVIGSAMLVGATVWLLALVSLLALRESFHHDLDFIEA